MNNHINEIFDIIRIKSPLPDELICKILYGYNCIIHPIAKQIKKEYQFIKDTMFFKNTTKYYNIMSELNIIGNNILNQYNININNIYNIDNINNNIMNYNTNIVKI